MATAQGKTDVRHAKPAVPAPGGAYAAGWRPRRRRFPGRGQRGGPRFHPRDDGAEGHSRPADCRHPGWPPAAFRKPRPGQCREPSARRAHDPVPDQFGDQGVHRGGGDAAGPGRARRSAGADFDVPAGPSTGLARDPRPPAARAHLRPAGHRGCAGPGRRWIGAGRLAGGGRDAAAGQPRRALRLQPDQLRPAGADHRAAGRNALRGFRGRTPVRTARHAPFGVRRQLRPRRRCDHRVQLVPAADRRGGCAGAVVALVLRPAAGTMGRRRDPDHRR